MGKDKIKVAYKICDNCGGHDISFCINCHEEVSDHNRCSECNRFVKTQPCPDCYGCGFEEEYQVGGDFSFFVGQHSKKEFKQFVGYKGSKSKSYKAKVIKIIKEDLIEIRVKGKNIIVKTEDL
jgi:hypothetical protein